MAKNIQVTLVCLALVGCGTRATPSRRDAGPSDDRPASPDSGVANHDVLAGSDGDGPWPEVVFEVAHPEAAVPPEALPDSAVRDVAAEPSPRDAGGSDLAVARDAADAQGSEALGADMPNGVVDVPPEAAREVRPFVVDGALASFCSGDEARMIVDGIQSYPVVTGTQLAYSCCVAGDFAVTTTTFAEPITVEWLASPGFSFREPIFADLANLPKAWSMSLVVGCGRMADTTCTTAGVVFESGFQGMLQVVRGSDNEIDTGLCLHFEAPAGSPQSVIKTLDLYAPHVVWTR